MGSPYSDYSTLRRKLNRSVIAIASVVVLTIPILYFLTVFYYEKNQLARDLARDVEFLSEMAFKSPEMWPFQVSRIEAGLSKDFTDDIITLKTVTDLQQNEIVAVGSKPHRFNIEYDTTLYSGFRQIGQLSAIRGIDHVIYQTGLALLFSLMLSLAMFFLLRYFPMRALERNADELHDLNSRLLKEIKEREGVERKLQHSQRLEAIGQLSAGIAHDFNNLLGVIEGNAELWALRDTSENAKKHADRIQAAVAGGASLTQRLLAFSRQQPLESKCVVMGSLIDSVVDLLRRSLPATIIIETRLTVGLWAVRTDPSQLQNAIINLALNARDAMPSGGIVTIECENCSSHSSANCAGHSEISGDYVLVTVSDSGHGMTDEVKAHVFEPFYTTKEFGKGSGLGLSMIYGFAQQSGGHVSMESEVGRGTRVSLYLPRHDDLDESVPLLYKPEEPPRGHGESLLVVEDNPALRELLVSMLKSLNYRVIHAQDAAAAYVALDNHQEIQLLLSDVVLPGGQSGPQFVEEATGKFPHLEVVFMSGYAAAARNSSTPELIHLKKPFTRIDLAITIHAALRKT